MTRCLLALAFLFAVTVTVRAEPAGPQPPCGSGIASAAAAPGDEPAVQVLGEGELASPGWSVPPCLPWTGPTRLVAAVSGRIRAPGGLDELLGRIGAFSRYDEIRYWSSTHGAWRPLLGRAERADGTGDVPADQFQPGRAFAYRDADSGSASTQRLMVLARTPERAVLALQNTGEIRLGPLPLFAPGALQSAIFLDHESGDVWRQVQIVRVGAGASRLAFASPASYANRLAAFYRYVAGQMPVPGTPSAAGR
ncbi:MAG: DUF6675 family protein [Reyranellaceae bacterium]